MPEDDIVHTPDAVLAHRLRMILRNHPGINLDERIVMEEAANRLALAGHMATENMLMRAEIERLKEDFSV